MGSTQFMAKPGPRSQTERRQTGRDERRPAAWIYTLCGSALLAIGSSGWAVAGASTDASATSATTPTTTASPTTATTSDATNPGSPAEIGLAEIVVTAERYNSTIQNTPISMSAMTGDQLTAAGITNVEAIAQEVPGLSMRSAGPGLTEYEARGIASNGGAAPTVGFYLDDVPLSPPAMAQVGKVVIDPDLYDVDRVEVLRGPQGTLYGSGSMGGTVKVLTNQPKLDSWEGSFQGTLSDTQGGSGNGGGNFMLNIPLGDTLALRTVATDTYRSGWIDRVVLNPFPEDAGITRANVLDAPVQSVVHDVNTENLYGSRTSLLFQPSSDFSVVAMALYQRMVLGGYDDFDSPPGSQYLAHYEAFNIPEPIADTVHIYSLTAAANLGFADLTSVSAYWNRAEHQTQDASESISYTFGIYPYVSMPYSEIDTSKQFSQEIRLSSRGDDRLHWVTGAFYSDLNSTWVEYSANTYFASPPNPAGVVAGDDNPYKIEQLALFADGSYKITDQWKFETGLRWYRYQSTQFEQSWGVASEFPAPMPPTRTAAADTGFNPRFDLSYSPNADLTTYMSASKGFRPGGANQIVPPPSVPPYCSAGAKPSFGSDSVWDYEAGEKAKLFDNWLSVNSDFYYIKWSDVQETLLLLCGYEYDGNAGNGRSFGPEVEVNAKLPDGWAISASGAYADAKLTQPNAAFLTFLTQVAENPNGTPYCRTTAGCTAPILNVPRDTASLALIYSIPVLQNYQMTARVGDVFVGKTTDEAYFYGLVLPSYNIADARIGLSSDRWSASLFVDNLTNKVAELTANNTSFQFNIPGLVRYTTNQPRTVGMQVNYEF
jgi:iron complex outermembrane recepter protein